MFYILGGYVSFVRWQYDNLYHWSTVLFHLPGYLQVVTRVLDSPNFVGFSVPHHWCLQNTKLFQIDEKKLFFYFVLMCNLALDFFEKDNKYVFKAINSKLRNLENLRLKPVFRYTIFICICVGRLKIIYQYNF